mmetsp:Transcript_1578/g.4702  ORF Transcript_1578/g.4702 Transcript_1578/m.4702 type:complete len:95 (+) Transcript_1578:361-645(+)
MEEENALYETQGYAGCDRPECSVCCKRDEGKPTTGLLFSRGGATLLTDHPQQLMTARGHDDRRNNTCASVGNEVKKKSPPRCHSRIGDMSVPIE